jgi:hypothetical protein
MFVTFVKIQRREWDSNSLKNSFNNIENTAASVKQSKAVVKQCSRIANGSQLSDHLKRASLMFHVSPLSSRPNLYGLSPAQSFNFRIANNSPRN